MRPKRLQRRPAGRLAGASIRRLLVLLVVAPVAGVLVLAGVAVRGSTGSAVDAARVESLVREAVRADAARVAVQQEIIPEMGLAVSHNPRLRKQLGISDMQVPITPATVSMFRHLSDDAIGALTGRDVGLDVAALRSDLAKVRRSIQRGTDLQVSYQDSEVLVDRVTRTENRLLQRAAALRPDADTAEAVADVQLLAETTQQSTLETPLFFQVGLGGLASADTDPIRYSWRQVHHRFLALSQLVATTTAAPVARAWAKAVAGPDATTIARTLDRAEKAGVPRQQTDVMAKMFVADNGRSLAFGQVLQQAADRATTAAASHRTVSLRHLLAAAASALAVVLLSLVSVLLVGRALTRPLDRLAAQATRVGEGELDDVQESGPREVRTVARGLSVAVGTLRKIQEQMAAVTSGDLHSPVLREPLPGALGGVVHRSVTAMVESIRERHRLQDDLAHQAAHDSLTGLANRAHAMTLLTHVLESPDAAAGTTALLFVDLDYFKQANDTFGHRAGDEVLRAVADRLRTVVRSEDTVARLGGDEFLVVLRDVAAKSHAVAMAERLVAAVSEPFMVEDSQILIGASVGVAFSDGTGRDAGRLLVEADAAAYRAKSGGRSRVEVYDERLRAEIAHREELGVAMAAALVNGEFVVYYQPIVDLATGRELGFEALVRWQRPGHGLVPPDQFIPVAETSPLINDLGRWVLHEATRQLMEWSRTEPGLADQVVAVNVSGRHLLSRRIVDDVRDALTASGLEPSRLTVEITETVLVDDRHAVLNMVALRELGVRIAIDDFGTGFTSIGQLHHLPVDALKIDRSFVGSTDPAHAELVRLMVGAAHAYRLEVVAEGVENLQQAAALRTIDVDRAQGFLYARPVPAEAIPSRLEQAG